MNEYRSWVRQGIRDVGLSFVILLLTSTSVHAQSAVASGENRTEAAVMKVMQQWLDALQTRDMKALQLILGEEWTDNSRFGVVYTRRDFFAGPPAKTPPASAITASATHVSRRFENIRVRMYGDVAIVTGTVGNDAGTAESSANVLPRTIFTDVLVWRDGRWQAVTSQETAIPGKANAN
jgi:ketosteroid isomerase-like protein